MTNYSRTTLRELKKRYLNILKKCLLANLLAFSFVLPSMGETINGITIPSVDESWEKHQSLSSDKKNGLFIYYYGNSYSYTTDKKMLFGGDTYEEGIHGVYRGSVIWTHLAPVTFNNITVFKNNTVQSTAGGGAGAIWTGGVLSFTGEKDTISEDHFTTAFINNKSTGKTNSQGGAIYMGDTAYFYKKTLFLNNISEATEGTGSAGAIENWGKNLVFDKDSFTLFKGNKALGLSANGGAIDGGSQGDFNGTVIFESNIASATKSANGGAINYGWGKLNFNGTSIFIGNKAISETDNAKGGAFMVGAPITFTSHFSFYDNKTIMGNIETPNDIFVSPHDDPWGFKGTLNLSHGLDINGKSFIGTFDSGIINQGIINKDGEGILILGDKMVNGGTGSFTQTSGLTIAGSHNLALAETHTINGGELKTHGAEIGYKATLGETGTLTHLGTSADTPTEIKGVTFNGTGLNLTLGTYTKAEQEKEIALVGDRLVEYVDDKGTEDTADDELVSYQATDKLFTVNALENDQKAKFILNENLTGMEGNSITVAGAELDVKEGLKVAGKVVAKDMRLPAEKTSSFTALEVAEKGLLDIQNQTVTADTLSLNQEGAVKVSVHSLSDYGQILAKETVSKGSGTLTMNLIGAPQEGVYKVFEQDTDLKLGTTHEFFDISDLENGSYKIAQKKADELAEKFGLNEEETRAVSAVIGGNSKNEAFQKVQTEIMETLKSGNKGKAKKALSAVGAKEHPVEQSVASEHLVALQNVVQSEMHGTTVGHSGGEEEARAKVYIKGLYDRTKSSMGEGFRARSKGAVLGVQSEVTDTLTLGVGYATSQTTAKEDLRRTEVDTNTGFISAHYQPNAWWVSGLAIFSRGEYEEEKQILSSVGKASYNVDSWGAQVMTGYDIKLEKAVITPEVGLRYLSVKQEGYTDTLGTTVAGTRSDYLTALVGVKGTWDMGAIRPTAGVTVGYDIISDDVSALNTLANGASYTVNGEALDRLSTGVSLGVEADLGERTTLKLEYSGTFRKEYQDHSGMLKFELRF